MLPGSYSPGRERNMLKEVVMILWVCTPPAEALPDGTAPICRPEAMSTSMPAVPTPAALMATCETISAHAKKRWGITGAIGDTGTDAPDYGRPVGCFSVDHTKNERYQKK